MYVLHEHLRSKPKCRVELHIHMEGTIRPETIWEIMRRKQLQLPGDGSLRELKESLQIKEPDNLLLFLQAFAIYMPAFKGDLEAIERFSYEFVEDQSVQSVAYCEARICPHMFLPSLKNSVNGENSQLDEGIKGKDTSVTAKGILESILRGLERGEEKFGTKVRLVLSCIRGKNEWWWEILSLCEEYRNKGVVGIDVSGNDEFAEESLNVAKVEVFEAAKLKGIHRTIHAGEDAGWESIKHAISKLGAERIGHGYRVIENEEFYQKCLQDRIHFEMCPHSSYMTGSMKGLKLPSKRHPILRLAEDRASFSINSDVPSLTGTRIGDEYELLRKWGFTESHFVRANFEAAVKCFLPPDEKKELLSTLRDAYGVVCPTSITNGPSIPTFRKKRAVKIAA